MLMTQSQKPHPADDGGVPGVSTIKIDTQELRFLDPPQEAGELGRLAQYRVLRLLGTGGMGLVFLAEDLRLRRSVALKVMRPGQACDTVSRQRFLREARATAAVRSEHIVAIHDVGSVNDVPFFATEFLQGHPLHEYLEKNHRLTTAQVVDFGLQIARGLEAAHRSGLIHRDIKPANIWLEEPTERIKILDFGVSRLMDGDHTLTQCGIIVGTPAYMAPEQADARPVDQRCDLFSLGCVLYEMATGKKPFEASSVVAMLRATALRDPTPVKKLAPGLPLALADLIMKLLAKNPDDRPASATAVIEVLESVADTVFTERAARASRLRVPKLDPRPAPPAARPRKILFKVLVGLLGLASVFALVAPSLVRENDTNSGRSDEAAKETSAPPDSSRLPAVNGVTEDEILFGMTAPFSGTARELGRELQIGIETGFHGVNADGGICGRKLKLIALDDGYQPERALANMKELHESHKVFGVIGNVGTPTAEKTLPYALANQMLFLSPFTGATLLRSDPPDRYVFNYRASYVEETAAIVRHLLDTKGLKPEQIAVFAQQDGYGDAGFNGVARTLRQHGRKSEEIVRVGHQRNSTDVGEAVREILKHKEIQAAIMVSTYRPATEFIRQLRDAKRDLIFANVSFVGSDAFAEELRQLGPTYASGVIVTQVVPNPDSHSSAVLKYRELLHKSYPSEKPGFISLEGYIDAAILVEGLRRCGKDLTTEKLVEALESIHNLDIGLGTPIQYGQSEHQASHKVWGTVLDSAGQFRILELE